VKAQALKREVPNVELVPINLNDPSSVAKAMEAAYGVYGITDFWEHGYEREVRHGKTLVDAAKAAGVKHFIWSTFDHSELKVPHFESKWEVDGKSSFCIIDTRVSQAIRRSEDIFVHCVLHREYTRVNAT
jgi:uncharacterized protein YbjT (DUF2867 family)